MSGPRQMATWGQSVGEGHAFAHRVAPFPWVSG